MTAKKDLQLAYGLAIVMLVLGVLSYAAFPSKKPDQPVRLVFKAPAGKVLFSHKTHTAEEGYGIECRDCHHHPHEEEVDLRACGACHRLPKAGEIVPKDCLECHDLEDIEDTETIKKSDAFHTQCIHCHKEIDAGPEKCESCHVM